MQFLTSHSPGGRIVIHTPLGDKTADRERDVPIIENRVIEEMTERLGRPPTKAELFSGPKPADNRTFTEKMEFDSWRPKKSEPHPMDALADSLSEPDKPNYSGMTRNERLAADARNMAERDRQAVESDKAMKAKLQRLRPQLVDIETHLNAEEWRAERGSQRIHDLLTMLKRQLIEGDDPTEVKRLRSEVNNLLKERSRVETLRQVTLRDALEAEIKRIEKAGVLLADDESVESIAEEIVRLKQAEAEATAAREKADAELAEANEAAAAFNSK